MTDSEQRTLFAEVDRLRTALATIRDTEGLVCGKYGYCEHKACASSHRSWEIAEAALNGVDGGHLRAVIAAAYRRGQEEMRQRAKNCCYEDLEGILATVIHVLPVREE